MEFRVDIADAHIHVDIESFLGVLAKLQTAAVSFVISAHLFA
jgi:hypothetical protein